MDIDAALEVLNGKRVLVTGSTGFVGSHMTRRLFAAGIKPVLLVRSTSNPDLISEYKAGGAEIVVGDVTDRDSVFEAAKGAEYIIHIAALFREAKHVDEYYYKVNVEGTRNVLDAAAENGVKRMVHCSTVGVHSHILNPPADETEDYRPGDIYQETKCEGEKLARSYFNEGKVNGVVIRPAMIWGEGDDRMLKLYKGVSQRKFPVIGSGKTMTHWIYVHDLVNGFILAATNENAIGQVYIIAGETPTSISTLVETVAECAGVKKFPIRIPAWPIQILGDIVETICIPFGIEPPIYRRRVDFFTKDRHFDTSKAQSELGFKPQNTFKQEVDNIYQWYKKEGWLD
ncbi:MAG: NAD-dependent epimerase/dehydratase family protein [Pseudomonadales bacterium]